MDATDKPDPCYAAVYSAAMYPELVGLAKARGYALAVHGSLRRDFDLIAIPWIDEAASPEDLVSDIVRTFAGNVIGESTVKPHGRTAWTISIGFGHCALDLSFMPRVAAT